MRDFRGSFFFLNNSTGKQLLLAQSFTNFHNYLRRQGEVYWQKGFDIIQSRSYNTNN